MSSDVHAVENAVRHVMTEEGLAQAAIMQSIGSLAEGIKQTNERAARVETLVTQVNQTMHSLDKRLLSIESNSVNARVETLEKRVDDLVFEKATRLGQAQAASAVHKYGPLLVMIVLAIIILANSGFIKLGG